MMLIRKHRHARQAGFTHIYVAIAGVLVVLGLAGYVVYAHQSHTVSLQGTLARSTCRPGTVDCPPYVLKTADAKTYQLNAAGLPSAITLGEQVTVNGTVTNMHPYHVSVRTLVPVTPAQGNPGSIVTLTEANNGQTINLSDTQQTIKITLPSTFWTFANPSDTAVLSVAQSPAYQPTAGAPIGTGQGTVTVLYKVSGIGQASISASRTSCGEALRCTGNEGSFRVLVNVRP